MWQSRPGTDQGTDAEGRTTAAAARGGRPGRPRGDWIESFTLAADLALVGICLVVSAIPLVSAGGGVATASAAMDHWLDHRRWPVFRELAGMFRGALLPGMLATAAAAAVAIALTFDIAGLATGRVPGGRPVLVGTVVVAALIAAMMALTVVELGQRGGRGWYQALLAAGRTAYQRPVLPIALAGTLVPPVLIMWMIPILILVMPGFTLFAIHVVVRRLPPRP